MCSGVPSLPLHKTHGLCDDCNMHVAQKKAVGRKGTMEDWCGRGCHSPCRSRSSSGARMRRRGRSVLRRTPCKSSTSYACCCTMSTPTTKYSVTTSRGPGTRERTSLRTRTPTSIRSWLRSPRAPPKRPVVLAARSLGSGTAAGGAI